MLGIILVVLIGLIGGIAVGVQSPIAGAMGQRVGGTASSFIIHLSGMILSGLLLFFRGGEKIKDWHTLPWYMLGAGIFGLILYQTINVTLPRLGGTMMITLIIVGQLLAGMVIDHFGLLGVAVRPVDLTRIFGVIILLFGGYLIIK
jgi:bacterial/archaeal transporter family-2 protein